MQNPKRRQYTADCKREAVRLITDHGYGVTEAARNLGIHAHLLGRWKRQAEHQHHGTFGDNGHMSAEHEELLRWRKENQRLRREGEILKKTVRFFASESSCNTPALPTRSRLGRCRFCVRG